MSEIQLSLVSETEARSILRPFERLLFECVLDAWASWSSICASHPHVRIASRGRGRSGLVYELIVENVRTRFQEIKNVAVTEARGFVEIYIDGKVALRFKKVNNKLRSSNYPTKQQLLYSNQLPLFGDSLVAARLTVGYQLDPTASEITKVAVIYPKGRNPVWAYTIGGENDTDVGALQFPAPVSPVQPARVSSKIQKTKRKEESA